MKKLGVARLRRALVRTATRLGFQGVAKGDEWTLLQPNIETHTQTLIRKAQHPKI